MRLLLDVSAVPARPVGAGVYTCTSLTVSTEHDELDLHLLDPTRRRRRAGATRTDGATVHAEVPESPAASASRGSSRGAPALATRLGVDLWHGPHYTMPMRLDVPSVVTVLDLTFFDHPEWHERSKVVFFRR